MLNRVRKAIEDPEMAAFWLRQRLGERQNRRFGIDVMAEDWDTLLILDACRYDMFERLSGLDGTLERRRSRGSGTVEFVRNNFAGREFNDTVYVTTNPFVSIHAGDAFHDLVELWRTDWDDELGTVMPDVVADAVRRANERYPEKRIVGHFMQPHRPFVGPTGRKFAGVGRGLQDVRQRAKDGERRADGDSLWELADKGEIPIDDIAAAFDENLEVAFEEVAPLVEGLDGKTVVTSDHGNILDEPAFDRLSFDHRRFGHPLYCTASELVDVPWLVCPFDERRSVVAEEPTTERDDAEDETVSDRLEALGYK